MATYAGNLRLDGLYYNTFHVKVEDWTEQRSVGFVSVC